MLKKTTRSVLVVLSLILATVGANADLASAPKTPDLSATPGELCDENNPDFSEYRYDEEIPYCERNVETRVKVRVYEYYHIPASERRDYTIDHLIPLSVGGSNNVANLWPEHRLIKRTRMNLEMEVYTALKDGRITQHQAVEQIMQAKMNPELLVQ